MFNSNINSGLSAEQVSERIKNGLSNGSFDVKTKSCARIVCENVFTLFNLINLVLAVTLILVGSIRNTLFMGVVICNTAIGIFQEIRAKRTIDKLSIISAPKVRVIRGGAESVISTGELVQDDIMILSSGMQICADALVLDGECETDESLITGESRTIQKSRGSELYSGSFVISGYVKAQAVRVGSQSASGKITDGSKYIKKTFSEMMRSINRIIKIISIVIVPFGAILIFKSLVLLRQPVGESVTAAAAALIGMIPEGLVLLTGIALAVSAVRLSKRHMLCQDLYCVESLARIDTLCLDKTGTLTEGIMEVTETKLLDNDLDIERALSAFAAAFRDKNSTLKAIAERFQEKSDLELVKTVAFSSSRKWSAAEFSEFGTLVLGAPEFVLKQDHLQISEKIGSYSEKGMRILVLAQSPLPLPNEHDSLPNKLSAKALIVLSDKLRASARSTLEYFRKQDVNIKIISGDDPEAVSQIASGAGLLNSQCADMSKVSSGQIPEMVEKYSIFGRTTPEQKLEIIRALKAAGHKTAMTGDGVNDVLALREADCSVAMQSGSDAVRAVSQIVLMDSDFSSMPLAVEEGRRCINNIRRSAALFLTKTIFSSLLTAVYLFLPLSYPFKPIQLTLISAVLIGIPSFLLAMEPNKKRVSEDFLAHIMKRSAAGGIAAALGVCLLTASENALDLSAEQLSTMSVILTAVSFTGTLFFVCKPVNNPRAVMIGTLIVLFSAACLLLPELFYLTPLDPELLFALFAAAVLILIIQAMLRFIFSKLKKQEN